LVTVKVRVPALSPEIVILVPVPAVAPGFTTQFPEGNPFKITLPVETEQVGCVIVDMIGALGVTGCTLMITFDVAADVHPKVLVTVKEYVPAANPEMVRLTPVPAIAPGLIVQFPAGKPVKSTLPDPTEHVVWVIVLKTGADGVIGCELITISTEGSEIQPAPFVTVKL